MSMKVHLFGRFCLSNGDLSLSEKDFHSNKLVKLLVYILLYRHRNLTHQELMESFWEDDRTRNPEGALKNLIYRLRSLLRIFGEQEYILTLPGAYQWNPEVSLETDYECFEEAAKAMRSAPSVEEKKRLGERAVELYQKDVSSSVASEDWMASVLTYYRLLYMETVKALAGIFEKEQNWDRLENVCLGALDVDALDEDMYYWLIRSQIGKKKYDQAMEWYDSAKKTFYDNLGIRQIARFDQIYEEILELSSNRRSDIRGLLGAVCEKEKPKESFLCEYPVFREFYRIEARRMKRTGIAEYLILISIKKSGHRQTDGSDAGVKAGMQILEDILRNTLRIGDVAAKYSATQYVLLLPNCNYESALQVSERLDKKFRSAAGKRRLQLHFELEALLASGEMG